MSHTVSPVMDRCQDVFCMRYFAFCIVLPFRTLAEVYGRAGQPQAGLQVLAEAVTLIATTEMRWWEAEVYRL